MNHQQYGLGAVTKPTPPKDHVECCSCQGQGTILRAGILIVFDEKCRTCKGAGYLLHPQLAALQPRINTRSALDDKPIT